METPYQTPNTTQAPHGNAPLTPKQVLLSLQGRIPRSTWWLYTILTSVVFGIIVSILLGMMMKSAVDASTAAAAAGSSQAQAMEAAATAGPSMISIIILILLYIPMIWIGICISAKRCHDCDKSGWWMLIPIYGFILVAFLPGTPGPNRFGPNPLAR